MKTTIHGQNIAEQIAGRDASGRSGTLTAGDVHEIIDQIHTNLMDGGQDESPIGKAVAGWLMQAYEIADAEEAAAK